MNFTDRYGMSRNQLRLLISEGRKQRARCWRHEPRVGWIGDPNACDERLCTLDGCTNSLPPKNTTFCSRECRNKQMRAVRHQRQAKYATEEERREAKRAQWRASHRRRVARQRRYDLALYVLELEGRHGARGEPVTAHTLALETPPPARQRAA